MGKKLSPGSNDPDSTSQVQHYSPALQENRTSPFFESTHAAGKKRKLVAAQVQFLKTSESFNPVWERNEQVSPQIQESKILQPLERLRQSRSRVISQVQLSLVGSMAPGLRHELQLI